MHRLTLPLLLCCGISAPAWAGQCAERPGGLEYLGRSADGQHSYWLSATNPGNYRLSAPGVSPIDTWSATGNALHLSESSVVANDANGIHYLDRMTPGGTFDCFLHSRNQTNPLLPPTWRPPARPELPEVVRPQIPDRPIVVRPELPSRPVAIKPELPDLPIAVRPIKPELPEVVRPELPGRPEVVRPEPPVMTTVADTLYEVPAATFREYCPDSSVSEASGKPTRAACPELAAMLQRAPLTPGRDLLEDTSINFWVDTTYQQSRDQRGFTEARANTGTLSLGADYRLAPTRVAGLMLAVNQQDEKRFWGYVTTKSTGWLLGPYAAFSLNEHWSLFANLTVGMVHRDHEVLSLAGESHAFQYSTMLNAMGEYALDSRSVLRPKLGITYLNEAARTYQLSGAALNRDLTIIVDGSKRDSGQIQTSVEYNTRIESGPRLYVPYVEVGALYNYLDADRDEQAWRGLLRAGARVRAGSTMKLDLSAGYQSLGVSQLSLWDARLFASWAFH